MPSSLAGLRFTDLQSLLTFDTASQELPAGFAFTCPRHGEAWTARRGCCPWPHGPEQAPGGNQGFGKVNASSTRGFAMGQTSVPTHHLQGAFPRQAPGTSIFPQEAALHPSHKGESTREDGTILSSPLPKGRGFRKIRKPSALFPSSLAAKELLGKSLPSAWSDPQHRATSTYFCLISPTCSAAQLMTRTLFPLALRGADCSEKSALCKSNSVYALSLSSWDFPYPPVTLA